MLEVSALTASSSHRQLVYCVWGCYIVRRWLVDYIIVQVVDYKDDPRVQSGPSAAATHARVMDSHMQCTNRHHAYMSRADHLKLHCGDFKVILDRSPV